MANALRAACSWLRAATSLTGFLLVTLAPPNVVAGSYNEYFNAVRQDQWYQLERLLARGFDPNTVEPERGETGLMLALREGHRQAVEVLLKAPALDLEVKARNGDTALMIAALTNNRSAVEALLAREAEVNRPGWTALHYAASVDASDIVQLLLDHYAYIDAESPNKTTPLMMAARGGQRKTVTLLLDEGADASLKNDQGFSAFDLAKKFDHADIAEVLSQHTRQAAKAK